LKKYYFISHLISLIFFILVVKFIGDRLQNNNNENKNNDMVDGKKENEKEEEDEEEMDETRVDKICEQIIDEVFE